MAFYLWNYKDYFKKLPSINIITLLGKKKWDFGIEYVSPQVQISDDRKLIFTMPSFARHGRWGNMIFQYLFISILAQNNDGEIELFKVGNWLNDRMDLYKDLCGIPTVQTRSTSFLLDSYHLLFGALTYIPAYFWRALYISKLRNQKCFILKNVDKAINHQLPFTSKETIEVEGLFMVNPRLYKQHKNFILNNLFQPNDEFKNYIDTGLQNLGQNKTIIGIHIRKGDFIHNPLGQSFQYPIPIKYIINWLVVNIPLLNNPVIFICSDDESVGGEIENAGFKIFLKKDVFSADESFLKYEQLDWEILRRCNIVLNSNSSFSFSASFLNLKNPICYQFSFKKENFVPFDPWETEPLQFCSSSPNLWSYMYTRFQLVSKMISKKSALKRLLKDVRNWVMWKLTKIFCLYYIYGFSLNFIKKLFNFLEFFQLNCKYKSFVDYNELDEIKL